MDGAVRGPMCRSMILRTALLACTLALAGCGSFQPTVYDTARLPAGALGSGFDPDVTAVNLAQWAFADPARTYGRPIEGARAAASMDYIAGQLNSSPRWDHIGAITKMQLLDGRQEVRAALGVRPGVPSQQVVNSLVGAANALAAGDQVGAVRALDAPIYDTGGEQVLARLANLPYMQMANVSTQKAGNELFQNDGQFRNF